MAGPRRLRRPRAAALHGAGIRRAGVLAPPPAQLRDIDERRTPLRCRECAARPLHALNLRGRGGDGARVRGRALRGKGRDGRAALSPAARCGGRTVPAADASALPHAPRAQTGGRAIRAPRLSLPHESRRAHLCRLRGRAAAHGAFHRRPLRRRLPEPAVAAPHGASSARGGLRRPHAQSRAAQ